MIACVRSLGIVLVLAGQSATPQQDGGQNATAIVEELRALRRAVEGILATNVRVQLLMGRLHLQEARIQSLIRQNAEIDSQIAAMTAERQALANQQRTMERASNELADPEEREFARQQHTALSERLKQLETRHASLLADQANVQQLVLTEQNRWGEFNQRLEELERMLAAPGR